MGLGGNSVSQSDSTTKVSKCTGVSANVEEAEYTWKEIRDVDTNKWVVIKDTIYDISRFYKKHPGGERLMMNHVGEDASDAFVAFHPNMDKVSKYLKGIQVGKVAKSEVKQISKEDAELQEEFWNLRETAKKMGCFKSNKIFYIAHFLQLIFLMVAAWATIHYFNNWYGYIASALMLLTVQAQASWLQHDFGHVSVFRTNKMNHFAQHITCSLVKGYPIDWWNFRHYQHHAKPNIIRKDPDIRFGALFMLGKIIPREMGLKKVGKYPYLQQQNYFFLIMPPLLMTFYFTFEQVYFMLSRKLWSELAWFLPFYLTWVAVFSPYLGVFGAIKFYILVRFLESHWFVWTTQMNHLPMAVDRENNIGWFRTQMQSTCNVEQSAFNDWFSGHLNFQIEHHLFPTMPRHNYHKIAPLVKSLCEKHNIPYINKSLTGAMADIYWSLKASGEMWYDAYNM